MFFFFFCVTRAIFSDACFFHRPNAWFKLARGGKWTPSPLPHALTHSSFIFELYSLFSATCVHKPPSRIFTEAQFGGVRVWSVMAALSEASPSHWRTELRSRFYPFARLLCVPHDAFCEGNMVDPGKDEAWVEFPGGGNAILPRIAVSLCHHTTTWQWW